MTISVTQLGNFLKAMVDSEVLLYDLKVEGEISNYRQSSEVVFFVLKDQNAQIDCFCYNPPKTRLTDGQQVVVSGKPNFYVKGGKLSFSVSKIQPKDIVGDKFKQLLELKQKLENMGLFDPLKKKPINTNCKIIGVVTSSEGAVIQDIINVSRRRNPTVDIVVYDSRVQGQNSEATIIRGLKCLEKTDVDTIIIARGGGSAEDLSSFNSEALVYAIADCKKPVISAVGHETDFTLCDFVADVRASTPSVAAEICTQNVQGMVDELVARLKRQVVVVDNITNNYQTRLNNTQRLLLSEITSLVTAGQNKLDGCRQNLILQTKYMLSLKQNQIESVLQRLSDNNPATILKKGFIVAESEGKIANSVKNLQKDQMLKLVFADGTAITKVVETEVKK